MACVLNWIRKGVQGVWNFSDFTNKFPCTHTRSERFLLLLLELLGSGGHLRAHQSVELVHEACVLLQRCDVVERGEDALGRQKLGKGDWCLVDSVGGLRQREGVRDAEVTTGDLLTDVLGLTERRLAHTELEFYIDFVDAEGGSRILAIVARRRLHADVPLEVLRFVLGEVESNGSSDVLWKAISKQMKHSVSTWTRGLLLLLGGFLLLLHLVAMLTPELVVLLELSHLCLQCPNPLLLSLGVSQGELHGMITHREKREMTCSFCRAPLSCLVSSSFSE